MHRPRDVLHNVFTGVDEAGFDPVTHLLEGAGRNGHRAGLAQALEPRGDVHAIAVDTRGIHQHIAQVHANAVLHALVLRQRGIALRERALEFKRAFHRLHHRPEFGQDRVAGSVDDATVVFAHLAGKQAPALVEHLQRGPVVGMHQPAIANHVGGKNGRQPAFGAGAGDLGVVHTEPFDSMLTGQAVRARHHTAARHRSAAGACPTGWRNACAARWVAGLSQSGSRRFLASSPHTTHHAGPQWAVQQVARAAKLFHFSLPCNPGPCTTGLSHCANPAPSTTYWIRPAGILGGHRSGQQ